MVLLIDNYDSFTFNLAHRLGELGAKVKVVRNDAVTVQQVEEWRPERIVISPGPGRPETAGISIELLRKMGGTVPTLGVCLGHQAISIAFGGRVERAPAPMHGKTSSIAHEGTGLYAGVNGPLEVGRYHSLVIPRDGVPQDFVVSSWVAPDGLVMGVRHQHKPIVGVQFHPESVLTPLGHRILQNFLEMR
jgi:anthranilate synthase/aminodeoxychorismate synthase-like glutamine amidotransferase